MNQKHVKFYCIIDISTIFFLLCLYLFDKWTAKTQLKGNWQREIGYWQNLEISTYFIAASLILRLYSKIFLFVVIKETYFYLFWNIKIHNSFKKFPQIKCEFQWHIIFKFYNKNMKKITTKTYKKVFIVIFNVFLLWNPQFW